MQLILLFSIHFLLLLLLGLRNFVASQDLFSNDDNLNGENSVNGLGFGSLAFENNENVAQQAEVLVGYDSHFTPNTDIWGLSDDDSPISFETSSDGDGGKNTDLVAASCLSGDQKLGARDEESSSCPNNPQKETVHIPTLEELLGAVEALQKDQKDKVCFPPRPFHLCCICGGWTDFLLCDFCEPCKFRFFLNIFGGSLVLAAALKWVFQVCSRGVLHIFKKKKKRAAKL